MAWPDFSQRAALTEWMDDDSVDFDTFAGCLKDLAQVNVLTLGHRPTLAFLARLIDEGFGLKAGRSVSSMLGQAMATVCV